MARYNSKSYQFKSLRTRAERLLDEKKGEALQAAAVEDLQSLVHELGVHKIELEMQNEELRKSEMNIEDQRSRYFTLYNFAPLGFVTINEVGLILESNLSAASLIGVEKGSLIKRRFQLFVSPEYLSYFNGFLMNLSKTRIRQTCEIEMVRQSNAFFYAQLFGELVESERGEQFLIAITDITNRKRMEKELRNLNRELEQRVVERTLQLEEANRRLKDELEKRLLMEKEIEKLQRLESIGTLAGGIAHDFNNILTVIMGNISLSKMSLKPDDKICNKLTEAETACMQAKELTYRLLTFSSGGEPLKEKIFISKMLKETVNASLTGSGIACEFDLPDDLYRVEVDVWQLKQAIANIIANAREAMTGKGKLKIYAENVSVAEDDCIPLKEGKYIKVSIEDNGVGIPEENLPKIFDPYFSTKERASQKGMGLGLSISYSIINRHDGLITVDSKAGAGTVFHIYLHAGGR